MNHPRVAPVVRPPRSKSYPEFGPGGSHEDVGSDTRPTTRDQPYCLMVKVSLNQGGGIHSDDSSSKMNHFAEMVAEPCYEIAKLIDSAIFSEDRLIRGSTRVLVIGK